MQRRLALLLLFAAVADVEAGRLIRGGRSGSPPPPPPPPPASPGVVPSSPTFVLASGSTSGAKSIAFDAPLTRYDGSAISNDPVTGYTAKAYRVDNGALAGSNTGTSSPITITGLPATAMVARVTATNSTGDSEESLPSAQWTGT